MGILLLVLVSFIPPSTSSPLRFIRSFTLPSKTALVSQDRAGNIYYVDSLDNILKYDSTGQFLVQFSPQEPYHTTLIESWHSISTFTFHQDAQTIRFIDRFLTEKSFFEIVHPEIGFAELATISSDNQCWVLDNSDYSLKKLNLKTNELIINNPLALIVKEQEHSPIFLKEYQNQVYLQDQTQGVLVFDLMGNYKKTLPIYEDKIISFYNNYLYYQQEDTLHLYHLYDYQDKTYTTSFVPDNTLLIKNKIYLFHKNIGSIYSLD